MNVKFVLSKNILRGIVKTLDENSIYILDEEHKCTLSHPRNNIVYIRKLIQETN